MSEALSQDEVFMQEALRLAQEAQSLGEVPIGAVAVWNGQIIGRGYNLREKNRDPLGHAEIYAIKEASVFRDAWRLIDVTLYVTLEPCAMCAGAMVHSRIARLVYGAEDPKAGYVKSLGTLLNDSRLNHQVEVVSGVLGDQCSFMLSAFFRDLRSKRSKGGR